MEQLVDEGKAAYIGVSNFSEKALMALLAEARIKPVANQIELHPLLAQRRLVGACLRQVTPPPSPLSVTAPTLPHAGRPPTARLFVYLTGPAFCHPCPRSCPLCRKVYVIIR